MIVSKKGKDLKKTRKKTLVLITIIIIVLLAYRVISSRDKIFMIIYKTDYSEYVEKYANEYNIDKNLIFAIIKAESNFDKKAISHKGAIGLMQLMQSTAEEIAPKVNIDVNEENIFNPEININLGTKYISMLIQKYGNIELAVTAYNAGSGNVDSWLENGVLNKDGSDLENVPFTETNNYVRKILRDYEIYKKLYN